MNLRLKLFLLIGSLFILIAILSFYLPQLLLSQDLEKIRETFNTLMIRHQEDDHGERRATFLNRVQEELYLINSDLSGINDTQNLKRLLSPSTNPDKLALWKEAVKFSYYNPEVGFVQISDGLGEAIAIALDNGKIYTAEAIQLTDNLISIELTSEGYHTKVKDYYIGVKIDLPLSNTHLNIADQYVLGDLAGLIQPSYYYLYTWDKFFKLPTAQIPLAIPKTQLSHSIHRLAKEENSWQNTPSYLNNLDALPKPSSLKQNMLARESLVSLITGAQSLGISPIVAYSISTIQKRFRIREEAALLRRDMIKAYIQNLTADSPLAVGAPIGITILTPNILGQGKPSGGYALLGKDLFFDYAIFDDLAYYLKNSSNGRIPIAMSQALIDSPPLDNIYVGNTLSFQSAPPINNQRHVKPVFSLITLGTSLGPILEDLAISTELVVFLTDDNGIRAAFNASGKEIPPEYFKEFPVEQMVANQTAEVVVNGITYDYFKMQPVPSVNTFVLIIVPQSEEIFYQFKQTMLTEMLAVSQNISYQLLAVSLLCLGISLIVLGILSGRITKPIALLAKATEDVSKGHYSEINLPRNNNSNDEIAVLSNSFSDMVNELREREKIRGVLNKVVSKEIAEEILKGNIHLGGEEKIISILFSDIRHFSKMTEHLPPQIVIELLNAYMTKMSDIIEQEGGVIDKYVGDEVMALYGAPLPSPDHAYRSILTAIKMLHSLDEWNNERDLQNLPHVKIGVGIHTGIVVAGNMGAETRLNYTVLGANVNLASRLCMAAAPMQILITESTLNELNVSAAFIVEELPPMYFKGFTDPIRTYSVKGLNSNFKQTQESAVNSAQSPQQPL